jgi:Retroviral aspartyl protease
VLKKEAKTLMGSRRNGFLDDKDDVSVVDLVISTTQIPTHRRTFDVPFLSNNLSHHALIDSGAMGCYIDTNFVKSLRLPIEALRNPITVLNVDNTENSAGKIMHFAHLNFTIHHREMAANFLIMCLGKQKVKLGIPWLEAENPDINWRRRTIEWRTKPTRRNIYVLINSSYKPTNDLVISFIRGIATDEAREVWNESKMNKAMLFAYKEEQMKEKKTAAKIVPKEFHSFLSVFSDEEASRMPKHTSYNHKIDLTDDFKPMTSKIFRIPPVNEEAFNKFIDENLSKGYI